VVQFLVDRVPNNDWEIKFSINGGLHWVAFVRL
jgi:hypothetical protein